MRILSPDGTLSAPFAGVPAVSAIGQVGLLYVALDPRFKSNKRSFFTYSEPVGDSNGNIVVARGVERKRRRVDGC
jgi:glucose/arabinose dehydrogenase